jgi:hypothetical protein
VAEQERNPAGSVSAAIACYYTSAEYRQMAESTRANYRRVLERFRAKYGTMPLARLETHHVNAIIDKASERTTEAPKKSGGKRRHLGGPAAANVLRKRLHTVFEYEKQSLESGNSSRRTADLIGLNVTRF